MRLQAVCNACLQDISALNGDVRLFRLLCVHLSSSDPSFPSPVLVPMMRTVRLLKARQDMEGNPRNVN
jgi:hypothetical protein